MNIQDLYKYSWFSTLAYVNWRKQSGLSSQELIEDASTGPSPRIPGLALGPVDTLGERIFSLTTDGGEGWQVADFHPNEDPRFPNDAAGFAASLFVKTDTGEKILALAVLDPAGNLPCARFSIANYFTGGRHPIGRIGLGMRPAAAELDPSSFDDPGKDQTLRYAREF